MTDFITVRFKSSPVNWEKERDGRKPNTFRKITDDLRFNALHAGIAEKIEIVNTETLESFTREITDYTVWDGYVIISWKHEVYGDD